MDKGLVTDSSGNVFADLGFSAEESTLLTMRAEFNGAFARYHQVTRLDAVRSRGKIGIGQSRISGLMRGKWEKFSLNRLVTLTTRTGQHVELVVG